MTIAIAAAQGAALVVFLVFALLYQLLASWRSSATGRLVMSLALAVAGLSASGLAASIFGEYPGRQAVRLLLLSGIAVLGVWLIRQLVSAQVNRDRNG